MSYSYLVRLNRIKNLPFVNVKGRGIEDVSDKWDVLSPSKYSIAYENFQNDYYWTEKITDCFLSYTMPLYVGCNQISNFFPKSSFIQIDPNDKHIHLFLKEIVDSKKWEQNLDALVEARNLALNHYQLFPFILSQIEAANNTKGHLKQEKKIHVKIQGGDSFYDNVPANVLLEKRFYKYVRRIKNSLNIKSST